MENNWKQLENKNGKELKAFEKQLITIEINGKQLQNIQKKLQNNCRKGGAGGCGLTCMAWPEGPAARRAQKEQGARSAPFFLVLYIKQQEQPTSQSPSQSTLSQQTERTLHPSFFHPQD